MFPVKSLDDLETLSKEMKWQWFEKLVGFIFEENDFDVAVNSVEIFENRREKQRRQFDIIARRFQNIFLVECKKWSGGRYKTGLLKRAVEDHLEKCLMFKEKYKKDIIPLIVTLLQEDVKIHEGVPIIPIDKLNTFINSFEEIKDKIRVI